MPTTNKMSSRAFRVTINGIPHLFNLNHVNKVAVIGDTMRFYFSFNKEITGMSVMGSGFIHGHSPHSVEVKFASKEDAHTAFEEIAKLM
jgi:hypothetical protein